MSRVVSLVFHTSRWPVGCWQMCLLPLSTNDAFKARTIESVTKASQLSLANTTLATFTVPVPQSSLTLQLRSCTIARKRPYLRERISIDDATPAQVFHSSPVIASTSQGIWRCQRRRRSCRRVEPVAFYRNRDSHPQPLRRQCRSRRMKGHGNRCC
jgi:hypothetical protein